MKTLGTKDIQGVKFYFTESPGDGVIAAVYGYFPNDKHSDFIALFNDKKEAIRNLSLAKITKISETEIEVENLKAINLNKYY